MLKNSIKFFILPILMSCLSMAYASPLVIIPAVKQANFVNLTHETLTITSENPVNVVSKGVFDPNKALSLTPFDSANLSQNQPNYLQATSLSKKHRSSVDLVITDSENNKVTTKIFPPLTTDNQTTLSFNQDSQTTTSVVGKLDKYILQVQAAHAMGATPTVYILTNPAYNIT